MIAGLYCSQIRHYKIVHTFREGNRCADAMARQGVNMDSDFVLLSCVPKDMRNLVAFDASGEALPWSIPRHPWGFSFPVLMYPKKKFMVFY